MSDSFESLMQRHEMGQAYKKITSEMGPSPQLVAFVNYDSLNDEGVALESFDSISQHRKILEEIEADQSYEMALEGLSDTLGRMIDKLKRKKTPTDNVGGMKKSFIFGRKLKSKSPDQNAVVPPHTEFEFNQKAFDFNIKIDKLIFTHMPSTFDLKAWEDFSKYWDKEIVPQIDKWIEEFESPAIIYTKKNGVKFKESGWTEDSFKNGIKWLDTAYHELDALEEKFATKLDSIRNFMRTANEKDHHDPVKLMKVIGSWVGNALRHDDGLGNIGASSLMADKNKVILDHVSHHFEISE